MERAGDVGFVMRMVCLDGMDKLRTAAKIHVGKRRFWQKSHAIRRLSQAREMWEW
jgi:hypothetical protein